MRTRPELASDERISTLSAAIDTEQLIEEIASRITTLLRESSLATLHAHFAVGDEIHRLRCNALCGSRPLARLAASIGRDESGLQKMARVAETIRGPERQVVFALLDKRGFPLAPSLVAELERVRQSTQRIELARLALDEGLTVTELRARIGFLKSVRRVEQ